MTILQINGVEYDLNAKGRTILEVLRNDLGLTGAKLGCGEGECGACTILVDGRAVCACLQLASSLGGRQIETIENARTSDTGHAIIRSLAEASAVQCGFCTTGFVMAATEYVRGDTSRELDADLEGNLCRCTGYAKIRSALEKIQHAPQASVSRQGFKTRDMILEELSRDPVLVPIAGGTDILVRHEGKLGRHRYLDLTDIHDPTMTSIIVGSSAISIGALTTWSQLANDPIIERHLPILRQVARWIGGLQIRNAGTLGGNIATASPAGDSLPALVALGARVELDGPAGTRETPIADFLLAPGRTAIGPGELIVRVLVPTQKTGIYQSFQKVGPRRAQAISKLSLALIALYDGNKFASINLAFGAVGPVPMTCPKTVEFLQSAPLSDIDHDTFLATVAGEISPIDDFRSSKAYRANVAPRLLWRELQNVVSVAATL